MIDDTAPGRTANYKQEADLDLLGKTGPAPFGANPDDREWAPIGPAAGTMFAGTFDGNGKSIKNIYIHKTGSSTPDSYLGLFGWVSGTVRNVTLQTGAITGHAWIGGVAGRLSGGAIIDCVNGATVTGRNYPTGGNYATTLPKLWFE